MAKLKILLKNFDDMSLYMPAVFLPAAFAVILNTKGILGLLILFAEIISAVPHECGHYIFNIISIVSSLTGMNIHNWEHFTFVAVIAGSLGYTVVPIILAVFYLLRRDLFRCSGYIAFLAVSVDHMAWYCADALNQDGPLIDTTSFKAHHDWYYMFTYLDLMQYAEPLSSIFYHIADFIACISIVVGVIGLVLMAVSRNKGNEEKDPKKPDRFMFDDEGVDSMDADPFDDYL